MNAPVQIPDGLTAFTLPSGASFSLDLIEACQAVNRIAEESKAAGEKNLEYVERFGAWVHEQAGVTLTKAQADWLCDYVGAEYDRQKKARLPAPTPNSPSSSEPPS